MFMGDRCSVCGIHHFDDEWCGGAVESLVYLSSACVVNVEEYTHPAQTSV